MKILLLLILLTTTLHTQEFYIGESISVGLIAADWKLTRYLAKENWTTIKNNKHYRHIESNLILGKKPSVRKVDIYMGAAIVAHIIIAKKLPRHWRYALWGATITTQAMVIYNHHKNGNKIF